MTLYNKTYTYDELNKIINSLDLINRILIGQYDEIFYRISWYYKPRNIILTNHEKEFLSQMLYDIRSNFIKTLNNDSRKSLGIWGNETPMLAIKSYDIQQVLRYQRAWHNNPEGEYAVVFAKPIILGKWKMTKEDNLEIIKPLNNMVNINAFNVIRNSPISINKFNDKTCEVIYIKSAMTVINKALKVNRLVSNGEIYNTFRFLYPDIDIDMIKEVDRLIKVYSENNLIGNFKIEFNYEFHEK